MFRLDITQRCAWFLGLQYLNNQPAPTFRCPYSNCATSICPRGYSYDGMRCVGGCGVRNPYFEILYINKYKVIAWYVILA